MVGERGALIVLGWGLGGGCGVSYDGWPGKASVWSETSVGTGWKFRRGVLLEEPGSRQDVVAGVRLKPASGGGALSRELAGDLPCVRCGYNLKGLTVKGMCPECGISVRTTLLAVVDPMAREFRRVEYPRAVAAGITLWAGAAAAASLVVWVLQAGYVLHPQANSGMVAEVLRSLEWVLLGLTVASCVGAFALLRPHGGLALWSRSLAVLGILAYGPLLWVVYETYVRMGPVLGGAFSTATMEARVPMRLIGSGAGLVILMSLRPHARALQARWLLMRIGAVARQTMLGMVAVLFVWVAADLMVLVASRMHGGIDDILRLIAKLMILVGGIFMTVGVFSVALDCWRIRGVILRPPVAADELFGEGHGPGRTGETGGGRNPKKVPAASQNGDGAQAGSVV